MNDKRGAGLGLIPPDCCDAPMALVVAGRAANVDVGLWRCLTCEDHAHTRIRTDGQGFWVGAMGDAIHREHRRVVADAYGGRPSLE
jgi:hypothetical protein